MPTKIKTSDRADVLSPEDREVVDLYYLEANAAGHAYHVVAAFVLAGEEPPSMMSGFSASQNALIQAHYDKYDPHGSRAQAATLKAALGDD